MEASDLNSIDTEMNVGLSKKQIKRNRREEYLKVKKQAKKLSDKKKKLEKKALLLLEKEQNLTEVKEPDLLDKDQHVQKKSRKDRDNEERENYLASCAANFNIIIDCNWESDHSESAIKSLAQQIMFSYGVNRRHSNPAHLFLTGLGPRVSERLTKVQFNSWIGVTVSNEDYIVDNVNFSVSPIGNDSKIKQLVYLTSDAEETLDTLDPSCAYIIGGIVDRNRLKGATYKKAVSQGVRTAKLPIKENFSMACTHILTVNHVYEILLNYAQTADWRDAIERVIPKRKGLELRDGEKSIATDTTTTNEVECGNDSSDTLDNLNNHDENGPDVVNGII